MNELKSKITNKRDIDWNTTIYISDLEIDPQVLEMHKQRINTVFANLSQEERDQQVQNVVLRDNLFSKAMDILVTYYDFDINPEDLKNFEDGIITAFGEEKRPYAEEIAKKLIMKALIFDDLQKTYDIKITDQELIDILQNYYQQTNQPIRDFMQDKQRFESAKATLLEEKTTAFIIEKFPRNLEELERKLYESLKKVQEQEKQDKELLKDAEQLDSSKN